MRYLVLTVLLLAMASMLLVGVAQAAPFMNITFNGDAIGSAPSTGPAGSPITTIQATGGYTATAAPSPPTADCGTIVVDNVAGMSKAAVMTTNPADGVLGALYLDTGFSQSSSQISLKFDISVLAAPTNATAQPKYLNDTSDQAGILFGINTYAPSAGSWAFRFAVAPTSANGGVFAFRSADNTRLITFGNYVKGQKYSLTIIADYATGTVDAYINGVLAISGHKFWNAGTAVPATTSEFFMHLNGESGYANQVAIDNIQATGTPFVPIHNVVTPKMLTSGDLRFTVDSSIHVGPAAANDAPEGFGNTSFSATVDKNSPVESTRYRTLRIIPEAIFGHTVMLSDIQSMSYATKNIDATLDWRYVVYTKKTGTNDFASWYHSRYEANGNPTTVKNTWQTWSTDQLLFTLNRKGALVYNKTWEDARTGDPTDACYFVDLILGANSGGGIGTSQLDAVTIALNDGEVATADLAGNSLSLDVASNSIYVKPTGSVVVDMNVSNLTQMVKACQALIGYNSDFLSTGTVAAGGGAWDDLIYQQWNVSGEINTAIGVNGQSTEGTTQDGKVAFITLTPKGPEGITQMVFLPDVSDVKSTFLSDMDGNAVWPAKVNSTNIYIDGTAPVITNLAATPSVTKTTSTITFSTSDAVSGVDHVDLYVAGNLVASSISSGYVLDMSSYASPGSYAVTVKAYDKAGNVATSGAVNVNVDKDGPIVTIPADYTTNTASVSISATATDAPAGMKSFTMNGVAFANPTTVTLVPGTNSFVFVATDNLNNVTTKTLTVTYTQPAPVINVYRSLAPNKYGSSSYAAWLANAVTGAVNGGISEGSGYAAFADFGNAAQDYTSVMVTSTNSWMGIAGGTELGTAIHFVWRLDNGVKSNPGAAKLDVRDIAIDCKQSFVGADSPSDNQIVDEGFTAAWNDSAPAASFGGTSGFKSALKGFNWDGSQWVEVTSGTQADLIVYGWFRYAMAPDGNPSPVTQSVTNNLYKQLAGSVPFGTDPRRTLDNVTLEVKYAQPNVANGTSGVIVTQFASTETAKPVISISSPADGLKTNTASQTIAGLVSDNNTLDSGVREATVSLNGSVVKTYNTTDPINFSDAVNLIEGNNDITVTAKDFKGNTESKTINVLLDTVKPTISISDNIGADKVLQGTYTITVTANDAAPSSGLAGAPVVKLDGNVLTASGSGPWTYTVVVDASTANGAHSITADISDQANNAAVQAVRNFNVNKNQITGTVAMGFVGTGTRVVTFVLNGTITMTANVDKNGAYKLTNVVPDSVTTLSAKTAWTLRQKLTGLSSTNGQTAANFTLLGGDINNTNSVNVLDYTLLKTKYFTSNAAADIDGNGTVNDTDYGIMLTNWFKVGDVQ